MLKTIGIFFLVLTGIVVVSLIYDSQRRIPKADVLITHVGRDTTFSIGRSTNTVSNGHIALRVTGNADDSTAVLSILYATDVSPTYNIRLPTGPVDTVISGDFYAEQAKITYLHNGVAKGHLRLQAIFGFPPAEWPIRKHK